MAERGEKISWGIVIYLLVKQIVNVILGAGLTSLILPVVVSALLLSHWKNLNYAAAVIIGLQALYYLPVNIGGLPGSWFYLTEGLLDFGVTAILIVSEDIKAYFNND